MHKHIFVIGDVLFNDRNSSLDMMCQIHTLGIIWESETVVGKVIWEWGRVWIIQDGKYGEDVKGIEHIAIDGVAVLPEVEMVKDKVWGLFQEWLELETFFISILLSCLLGLLFYLVHWLCFSLANNYIYC